MTLATEDDSVTTMRVQAAATVPEGVRCASASRREKGARWEVRSSFRVVVEPGVPRAGVAAPVCATVPQRVNHLQAIGIAFALLLLPVTAAGQHTGGSFGGARWSAPQRSSRPSSPPSWRSPRRPTSTRPRPQPADHWWSRRTPAQPSSSGHWWSRRTSTPRPSSDHGWSRRAPTPSVAPASTPTTIAVARPGRDEGPDDGSLDPPPTGPRDHPGQPWPGIKPIAPPPTRPLPPPPAVGVRPPRSGPGAGTILCGSVVLALGAMLALSIASNRRASRGARWR